MALIPFCALGAAIVSGALGMGGGMILMGVLAALVPVSAAMVLHGFAMFAANSARSLLLHRYIAWRALPPWMLGAAISTAAFWSLTVETNLALLYLFLGTCPLAAILIGRWVRLDFQRPGHAALCGLLVTGTQLLAGSSGPLLDMFFLRSRYDRHTVVATKAFTQTGGHLVKIFYYGALLRADALSPWLITLSVIAAVVGTRLGKAILGRLDERRFRVTTTAMVVAIAVLFTCRGLHAVFTA